MAKTKSKWTCLVEQKSSVVSPDVTAVHYERPLFTTTYEGKSRILRVIPSAAHQKAQAAKCSIGVLLLPSVVRMGSLSNMAALSPVTTKSGVFTPTFSADPPDQSNILPYDSNRLRCWEFLFHMDKILDIASSHLEAVLGTSVRLTVPMLILLEHLQTVNVNTDGRTHKVLGVNPSTGEFVESAPTSKEHATALLNGLRRNPRNRISIEPNSPHISDVLRHAMSAGMQYEEFCEMVNTMYGCGILGVGPNFQVQMRTTDSLAAGRKQRAWRNLLLTATSHTHDIVWKDPAGTVLLRGPTNSPTVPRTAALSELVVTYAETEDIRPASLRYMLSTGMFGPAEVLGTFEAAEAAQLIDKLGYTTVRGSAVLWATENIFPALHGFSRKITKRAADMLEGKEVVGALKALRWKILSSDEAASKQAMRTGTPKCCNLRVHISAPMLPVVSDKVGLPYLMCSEPGCGSIHPLAFENKKPTIFRCVRVDGECPKCESRSLMLGLSKVGKYRYCATCGWRE